MSHATTAGPDRRDDRSHWDQRYRARAAARAVAEPVPPEPPDALVRLSSLLPAAGRVIDLAGGDGGGALFLAHRGLETTVADISEVALAQAETFAAFADLAVDTVPVDLTRMGLGQVLDAIGGAEPVAITCWNYLTRALLPTVAEELPSGCRFLAAIATTTNLERNEHPSPLYLLQPGELADLVVGPAPDRLRVLHRREGWAEGRHRAELVVEAR